MSDVNDQRASEFDRRFDELDQRIRATSETVHRVSDRMQRRLYAQVEALIGLYRDLDGLPSLPPLRNWALSPDTARELHALIKTYTPRHVVECGSGASTVMLGHLRLAGLVEQVTSIDHEPVYFELTRQRLRSSGLLDAVDLRFSPLVDRAVEDRSMRWYDVEAAGIDPIDLLIVDGPPASTGPMARYPAVPLLVDAMRPGCLVVVDDFDREDEEEIVATWRERYPFELIELNRAVEKSLAVLEFRPEPEETTNR